MKNVPIIPFFWNKTMFLYCELETVIKHDIETLCNELFKLDIINDNYTDF